MLNPINSHNKRIILALLVPLILVVVFVLSNQSQHKNLKKGVIIIQDTPYDTRADADRDGLLDWEEDLWKTDKENPDTDGDGFLDGEEVRNDRNPLIPRPGDILTIEQTAAVYTQDENFVEVNKTYQVFSDLLPTILLATSEQLDGRVLDPAIKEESVNQAIISAQTPLNLYTEKDIKVTEDTSEERVALYALGYLEILNTVPKAEEDELVILSRAISNSDPADLASLNPNIEAYKGLLQAVLDLEVPKNLSTTHLEIVNNFLRIVDALERSQDFFEDPFDGLLAIEDYRRASDANLVLFDSLASVLEGII